jgi:hypothetical protein
MRKILKRMLDKYECVDDSHLIEVWIQWQSLEHVNETKNCSNGGIFLQFLYTTIRCNILQGIPR